MPHQSPPCELCGRVMQNGTTEHHLIPKTCHKNKWFKKQYTREEMQQTVDLCRDCHNAIHEFIPSEKELGRYYNTLDKLMAHEPMANFVEWARKQK